MYIFMYVYIYTNVYINFIHMTAVRHPLTYDLDKRAEPKLINLVCQKDKLQKEEKRLYL